MRDAAIAAVFALVAYFGFAKTLGINIGAGWIEKGDRERIGHRGEHLTWMRSRSSSTVSRSRSRRSNLVWCLVGTTLGTAIGVLPGLGPALTIALLLPITFKVEPTAAFILFAGIYYGAMYGGSTTSILLNTPGESATIVTALEGNRMARNGRAGAALATAAIGSFVAGTIGTLGITFLAPLVVDLALKFGPADYFALMVLAFVTVSAVLGSSMVRGLTALFFGIWLGLIGVDLQTGQPRFTFGLPELLDGVNVIVVAVGLFAVGETLYVASRYRFGKDEIIPLRGSLWMTPRGMEALVEAVAARRGGRLSDRRACPPAAPRSRPF